MNESFWFLFSLGLAIAVVLMTVTWIVARVIRNAGIVDAAWSLGFTPVVLAFAWLGEGGAERRLLIAALVCAWSLRLGIHVLTRVVKHHPQEDERYESLREAFPKRPWLMFFGFFQLQAVLLAVLCVPFALVAVNPASGLGGWEIAGAILWLIAISGEALADFQLKKFRTNPENRGKTCRTGLWRYSRHPNYFFEWITWVAFFVYALGSPVGWLAVIAPLVMLYFLTKVTGIPPTEARALQSRGDDYRAYQRTTSAFIPWFPGA